MARRKTALLPPIGAVDQLKGLLRTVCLRRCCRCDVLIGVALWPWSGRLLVETHGFCTPCIEALLRQAALEAPPRLH